MNAGCSSDARRETPWDQRAASKGTVTLLQVGRWWSAHLPLRGSELAETKMPPLCLTRDTGMSPCAYWDASFVEAMEEGRYGL